MKNSAGITLVEMLIVLAIGAPLVFVLTQSINQMLMLAPRTENSMLAIRQVQNTGYFISSDGLQTQTINTTSPSGFPLILSWVSWVSENTTRTTVTYTLANGNLTRREVVTRETGTQLSSKQAVIASYISAITAQYPADNTTVLKVSVTATLGNVSETRTYKTLPRTYE